TGQPVVFTADSGTGFEVGPLATTTIYYVIAIDNHTIQLANTPLDAYAGHGLRLDPMLGSGDQVLTPLQTPVIAAQFNPSAVRNAGSIITLPSHGFVTGQQITYTSTGTAIQGLTSGSVYSVIVVDADTIRLARSRVDALNGIALVLDGTGASGVQTL